MWLVAFFLFGVAMALPTTTTTTPDSTEKDGEASRKVLGSSVVTSVSVIMDAGNGTQTYYTDAVGKPVPKPLTASHLASPINLLNPDKYEFYTFDNNGDLVKRLMTLEEIQGIIASGDGEILNYQSRPPNEEQPEKRVDDVVTNVQNVLKEEMEAHKIPPINKPVFDTPDVSSTWSMILPAIFGNSGENIHPDKTQVVPTPETIMIESTALPTERITTSFTESQSSTKENVDSLVNKQEEMITSSSTPQTNAPTIEVHITPILKQNASEKTTLPTTPYYSTTLPSTTSSSKVTDFTEGPTNTTKPDLSTKYNTVYDLLTSSSLHVTSRPQLSSTEYYPLPTTTEQLFKTSTNDQEYPTTSSTHKIIPTLSRSTQKPISTTVKPSTYTKFVSLSTEATTPHSLLSTFFLIDNLYNPDTTTKSITSTKRTTLPSSSQKTSESTTLKPTSPVGLETRNRLTTTEKSTSPIENLKEITTRSTPSFVTVNTILPEKLTSSLKPTQEDQTTENTANTPILIDSSTQRIQDVEKLAVTELLNQLLYTTDAHEINALSDSSTLQNYEKTEIVTKEDATTQTDLPVTEKLIASSTFNLLTTKTEATTQIPTSSTKTNDIITETLTNSNSKPMAEVQSETATIASALASGLLPLNDTLDNKDVNEAVDSLISQIIEQGTLSPFAYISTDSTEESTKGSESTVADSEFKINENHDSLNSSTQNQINDNNRYEEIDLDIAGTTNRNNLLTETTENVESTTETGIPTKRYVKIETTSPNTKVTLNNELEELSTTEYTSTTTTMDETTPILTKSDVNLDEITKSPLFSTEATTVQEISTLDTETRKPATDFSSEATTFNSISTTEQFTTESPLWFSTNSEITSTTNEQSETTQEDVTSTENFAFYPTTFRTISEINNLVPLTTKNTDELTSSTTQGSTTSSEILLQATTFSDAKQNLSDSTKFASRIDIPLPQLKTPKPLIKSNVTRSTTTSPPETTWALVSTVAAHPSTTTTAAAPSENKESHDKEVSIDLVPKPLQGFGLEDTTSNLDADLYRFTELCNELAFSFWSSVSNGISFARSVTISPFAATSMLAMVFLGARGGTSGEMNDILRLDDMVTFNPHTVFKDVIDSIEISQKSGVSASVFAKELYSDKNKGKLLGFYKDRVKYFYDGHVEEVNFKEIGDIVRRRTNLLVKRYTWGKIPEYIKDNTLTIRPPLAGLSANIFETDCSKASTQGRDGELHFVVLPSIRQRKLIPIPAVVWRTGFLAGYDPGLDATAVSIGTKEQTISTIFVIPGQQGTAAPGDGLFRLEARLVESAFKQNSWSRLLRSLIPRPGLEVQIPRFAHRSIINATLALQKMGLRDLFNASKADLKGLNGLAHEMYLSDMIQVNTFATCGEGRIDESHHSEIYPATANRSFRRIRKINHYQHGRVNDGGLEEPRDYQRSFHDPLYDPSYLNLPLPLRPRQARLPDAPRLRFDRPFLYFVRHNPTGLILHMGRFNPRLLP